MRWVSGWCKGSFRLVEARLMESMQQVGARWISGGHEVDRVGLGVGVDTR